MKFLIQTDDNGQVLHDFSKTLIELQKFYDWFFHMNSKDESIIEINYCCMDNSDTAKLLCLEDYIKCNSYDTDGEPYIYKYTPVGSVEFVRKFAKLAYGTDYFPKPINVPEQLMPELYSGRICRNLISGEDVYNYFGYVNMHLPLNDKNCNRFFVKSLDTIKDERNGFYDVIPDLHNGAMNLEARMHNGYQVHKIFDHRSFEVFTNCQVSTMLDDIESEWRVFVYKGKGVDVKNYSGDPFVFPSADRIYQFIGQYTEAPEAYTLDVAVTNKGTWVLECHDFFSCGLYGSTDKNIPFMLNHAWFNIKNKILKHKNNG